MNPPTLAVWKFTSCDGCQLTLLDCEDELLALTGEVRIAHFLEASSADEAGPYDVSLVEGSITTPDEAERIHAIRAQSRVLVVIGACATAGGIQALRNFADVAEFRSVVYARPELIDTLATSTRSPRTCRSTTSCAAVRSTAASCWRCSRRSSSAAAPTSRTPASAPSASAAGSPA